MEQGINILAGGCEVQETQSEKYKNYTEDVKLFLHKPVEWEKEEEKISRARRYYRLEEILIQEKPELAPVKFYNNIINNLGWESLSVDQQIVIHRLRNLSIPFMHYVGNLGLTKDELLEVKEIVFKKHINLLEYKRVIEYYQKVEKLFQLVRDKAELYVAIFKPELYFFVYEVSN